MNSIYKIHFVKIRIKYTISLIFIGHTGQLGLNTIAILIVTCKAARFALCAYGAAVNLVAMELPSTDNIDPDNGMKS